MPATRLMIIDYYKRMFYSFMHYLVPDNIMVWYHNVIYGTGYLFLLNIIPTTSKTNL